MKKLVLGIILIAVLVVAAYLIHSPRPAEVVNLPAADPVSSPTPANALPTPIGNASVQPAHREPERQPDTQNAVPGSRTGPAQPAPPKDEAQQMAACRAHWESKTKREQAAHDAEAKDPAWAYAMEQKLREYTSRRLQGTSIELKEVDCKTTFCDLVVEAFDADPVNEINNALEDARKQPWSDFSGTSLAKTSDEGNTYRVELLRMHSYKTPFETGHDEQDLACARLISDRNLRQRAARDAQPRDAAWADQIEPLLRQHIVSRTIKHPVGVLDIECKTDFCRIRAGGQTEDSQRLFQQASREAAAEPWANLRVGEVGGSGYGNRWTADVTLYRQ